MNLQSYETFRNILDKIRKEEDLGFIHKRIFQNDPKMVFEACTLSKFAVFYIGEKLLNDKEFIQKLVKVDLVDETLYDLLSKNLQGDKDVVISFMKSGKFPNMKDYVRKNNLNNNPEVIRIAIKQNPDAIKCIGDELRNNLNFMLRLVNDNLIKENQIPECYGSNYLRFFSRVYRLDETMFRDEREKNKVNQYLFNIFSNKTLSKRLKGDLNLFYMNKLRALYPTPNNIQKVNQHSVKTLDLIDMTKNKFCCEKEKKSNFVKPINWADAKKELSLFN